MSKEKLNMASTEPVDLDESKDVKTSEQPSEEPEKKESDKETPKPDSEVKEDTKTESKDEPEVKKDEPKEEEAEESLPPPPPRPVSPVTKMKNELKEAFPTVSDRIITGILVASQGDLDQAFNACLYISDESMEEPAIVIRSAQPTRPPVPPKSGSGVGAGIDESGLTDDELLARKLQKEFEMEERRRRKKHQQQKDRRRFNQEQDDSPDEFDDIKNTFNQGLEEARTTLNGWVSGITKSFNTPAQDPERLDQTHGRNENPKLFGALGGSSFQRRSNPGNKFDEDPKILPNDFHQKISLSNNEPGANDDNGPALPRRKGDGPNASEPATTGKNWQSLNSDVPVNSDAFIVTDSEDEDKKDTIKL